MPPVSRRCCGRKKRCLSQVAISGARAGARRRAITPASANLKTGGAVPLGVSATGVRSLRALQFLRASNVVHQYWLKKDGGAWTIGVKNGMCADNSIADEGDLIGTPPQLAQKNAWPEREYMPEPD